MDSLNEKLNQYKIPIALSLVGLVLIIGGIFSSGLLGGVSNKPGSKTSASQYPKESLVSSQIKVDISGAVKNPGVYSLGRDSRVEDVVKFAGGFSASASGEYISKSLNLSQKLLDGQKVYVPFEGERSVVIGGGAVAGVATSGKVGINSGSQSQLEDLPGIGPVTAGKIIAGRPYQSLDELISKKSVSKSVFEKIKDLVDLQ